jgi:threonine aldolase
MFPDPPGCSFASDNAAGIHPEVLAAISAANTGHALAYGADSWTAQAEQEFNDLFGQKVSVFLTLNGTGTNILALATMLQPGESVLCTDWSHINDDEAAAPERILSTKLIPTPSVDGKMSVDSIHARAEALGNIHHAQPGVLSLTQATEWGTTYSVDEIGELCEVAHSYGMRVHVDGARIANAVAALGKGRAGLREMIVETGVDTMSFGGTKNGLMAAEAVIHLTPYPVQLGQHLRKQVNQLGSKMRFVAAQFIAALTDDRWLDWASHANSMATILHSGATGIIGDAAGAPPAVNSMFPTLPDSVAHPLRDWCFFWGWNSASSQHRWMTSWDTTHQDVDRFLEGLRLAVNHSGNRN